MIIHRVEYEKTSFYETPVLRVYGINGFPLQVLTDEQLVDTDFLCQFGKNVFVSRIKKDEAGKYYVEDQSGVRLLVERLFEIQKIDK